MAHIGGGRFFWTGCEARGRTSSKRSQISSRVESDKGFLQDADWSWPVLVLIQERIRVGWEPTRPEGQLKRRRRRQLWVRHRRVRAIEAGTRPPPRPLSLTHAHFESLCLSPFLIVLKCFKVLNSVVLLFLLSIFNALFFLLVFLSLHHRRDLLVQRCF